MVNLLRLRNIHGLFCNVGLFSERFRSCADKPDAFESLVFGSSFFIRPRLGFWGEKKSINYI